MIAPIPVTVIGGYLGAGKTTLVNHLLRAPGGERIAVLVNDFGEIAIDADLIESRAGDVISLAGGCVCCSFGSDLMAALMRLPAMTPPPDRVVIETSGVAMPRAVARTVGIADGLALEAVVVLADAGSVRALAGDRYVGDTVLAQLRDADLLLLNKRDLVDADALEALREWLAGVAPRAATIDSERGAVARELLFGLAPAQGVFDDASGADRGSRSASKPRFGARRARHAGPVRRTLAPVPGGAPAGFDSIAWRCDRAVDPESLARALRDPGLGIARAKGFVTDARGRTRLLQLVGGRLEWSECGERTEAGTRLVCVGARGRFARSAIEKLLADLG